MEMLLIPLFIKPEGGEVILETPSEKEEKKEEVKKQEPVKEEKKSEEKGINIEVIKDKWTTVLERVKKKKVSLEAMLREARIVGIDEEGRLVLGLPKTLSFLKERLEERPNRSVVEEKIREVYGVQIPVKFITMEDDLILDNPKISKKEENLSSEEIKNFFKGKTLE